MRTITEHVPERIIPAHDVVTNVYEFSELSDAARQQVRDWYLETYHTPDIFSEMVMEDLRTELYYYGVDDNTNILGRFEDACRKLFSEINDMYEKRGYEYFHKISDEDLNDELCGMGMEFLADGEIYND